MENRVEELRRMYGIKQEAFAREMGVSRQSIGSIENGRYNPSTTLAIKIARYFGLNVEDVFHMEGAPAWRTVEMLSQMPADTSVQKNRAHNMEITLSAGPITGQGNRFPSQFAYATFMTAFNGAEPVAVYNALTLLGKPAAFADILTEFEGNGLALLDGYAGTDPKEIARYLVAHDIPFEKADVQSEFAAALTEGRVFIVAYWNDRFFRELKGLRTVAGIVKDGMISLYNTHTDDVAPRPYRTLAEALRGKKFILGYLF